jgi:hypothetical protein
MGFYEISERTHHRSGGSGKRIVEKLYEMKDALEDLCEEVEEMEEEFGERDGSYGERDSEIHERRGVRGTGRYSRMRR